MASLARAGLSTTCKPGCCHPQTKHALKWETGERGAAENDEKRHHMPRALNLKADKAIEFVDNRPFNDQRYFLDDEKLKSLGWRERTTWEDRLKRTMEWYVANPDYWADVSGALLPHTKAGGGLVMLMPPALSSPAPAAAAGGAEQDDAGAAATPYSNGTNGTTTTVH